MLIGTHHSMSYLEPVTKCGNFLHFFTKTQEVDIETQYYRYGVRVFDIRLYVDRNQRIVFRHGSVTLKTGSVYDVLSFLNRMGDCQVRITFEATDSDYSDGLIAKKYRRFSEYCKIIEELYPYVTFFGGYVNLTGEQLYRFPRNKQNLKYVHLYYRPETSLKRFFARPFRYIWPRLFAKINNKCIYDKILNDSSTTNYVFLDFVNI